jgi:hypothetical protein
MSESRIIEGKIIRKKKRQTKLVLHVRPVDSDRVSVPVHVALDHPYEFLYLYSIIRVESHQDVGVVIADKITLLQCAPAPSMIPVVLQGIVDGRYPIDVIPDLPSTEEAQIILDFPIGRQRRVRIAEISRVLEGRVAYKPPRDRPPQVRPREMELLEELERVGGASGEHGWMLQSVVPNPYDTAEPLTEEGESWENTPFNLPEAPTPLPSHRGPRTREEYIVNKKIPQVRWMVRRVKDLYKDGDPPLHILDVGGGRGDLATALALALPTSRLTVVDLNQPSLDAGRVYAHARGCGDRIDFVYADMVEYADQESPPKIDLVVALHACGDLSDLAMSFAHKLGAAFVVCPCCYSKRKITKFVPGWERLCDSEAHPTLRRLAELTEKPEVSRLSMKLINSMRFEHMVTSDYCMTLEEYDVSISTRNHVLVGRVR